MKLIIRITSVDATPSSHL